MPDFVFAESFSRYKVDDFGDADLNANFYSRWTNGTFNNGSSINNTGRNGACLSMGRGSGSAFKTLDHSARWVTGFAHRVEGSGAANSDEFYGIQNNASPLFNLRQNADGTLTMYAGSGNPIATTDRALKVGRWYYLEVDVEFSGSPTVLVDAELRINGHVEASGSASSLTSVASLLSLTADANVHRFSGLANLGSGNSVDDLYIKNFAGYFGDIRVIALFPNGDAGATLQWTPDSGSVHYDRVNTHPADLTKYVETDTPGDIDTWEWEDCPGFSGTILAVNLGILARKDDEGTKSFRIVAGAAGGDAQSDEFFVSDVTPEYYETSYQVDPATGLAWTQVGFNASLFGVELMS